MALRSIVYEPADLTGSQNSLKILNQLLLPHQTVYVEIPDVSSAFSAIKQMLVRGAPAIALVAALALAVESPWKPRGTETSGIDQVIHSADTQVDGPLPPTQKLSPNATTKEAADWYIARLQYLVQSRPTAVNLADAVRKLSAEVRRAASESSEAADVRVAYVKHAEEMLKNDSRDNENIGRLGSNWIIEKAQLKHDRLATVLTHCNTGSLATAGYGTALGIIRSLHGAGVLHRSYYTETRPYNQGSRLTGYELLHDQIPATLITDSMAASLFRLKGKAENIVAVIVGADRVAANGDTANKIGTYALACLARQHGIYFVVAAPRTTIDLNTSSGDKIVIEERPQREMLAVKGPLVTGFEGENQHVDTNHSYSISTAAPGTKAWNPSFDVTPAELIDAIVTEVGVAEKKAGCFALQHLFEEVASPES